MITIITGLPGSGKSIATAQIAMRLFRRNKRWFERSKQLRKVASNLRFSKEIQYKYQSYIQYWNDPMELVTMRDVDIVWDEVAVHLDSTQWANLPLEVKRFLQQHRKRGIDIYGNTQTFSTIDVSMRRLVERLYFLQKIVGSRSPSPTRPPIRFVWGLVLRSLVDPDSYEGEKVDYRFSRRSLLWIDKYAVNVFDTFQEIQTGIYPPFRHVTRECGDVHCNFQKVLHI